MIYFVVLLDFLWFVFYILNIKLAFSLLFVFYSLQYCYICIVLLYIFLLF